MILISDRQRRLLGEAQRLHEAICSWATAHGLRAYRVITDGGSFFELLDPQTQKRSTKFPPKIQAAIESNSDALKIYADCSRELLSSYEVEQIAPPGIGSVKPRNKAIPNQEGQRMSPTNEKQINEVKS